ncbi:MAG TPA: hypothetical protein VJ752_04010 [Burkholderiaceae bacterium]|nr:hypothetical protein [Burkholderiaceae bacterium]
MKHFAYFVNYLAVFISASLYFATAIFCVRFSGEANYSKAVCDLARPFFAHRAA